MVISDRKTVFRCGREQSRSLASLRPSLRLSARMSSLSKQATEAPGTIATPPQRWTEVPAVPHELPEKALEVAEKKQSALDDLLVKVRRKSWFKRFKAASHIDSIISMYDRVRVPAKWVVRAVIVIGGSVWAFVADNWVQVVAVAGVILWVILEIVAKKTTPRHGSATFPKGEVRQDPPRGDVGLHGDLSLKVIGAPGLRLEHIEPDEKLSPDPRETYGVRVRVLNDGGLDSFHGQVVAIDGIKENPATPWFVRWQGRDEESCSISARGSRVLDMAIASGSNIPENRIGEWEPGLFRFLHPGGADTSTHLADLQDVDDIYRKEIEIKLRVGSDTNPKRTLEKTVRLGFDNEDGVPPRVKFSREQPIPPKPATTRNRLCAALDEQLRLCVELLDRVQPTHITSTEQVLYPFTPDNDVERWEETVRNLLHSDNRPLEHRFMLPIPKPTMRELASGSSELSRRLECRLERLDQVISRDLRCG